MMLYQTLKNELTKNPRNWLITGVAGFIGCNLLDTLLKLGQRVVGLDSFVTGHRNNLEQIRKGVSQSQWANFHFIEGDIRDLDTCRKAVSEVEYVIHHAALGSVPQSIEDPICYNQSNIDGFLNMLVATRDAGVKRFVYATSSSTYGDLPDLPKIEDNTVKLLSPYAVTKYVNEVYADVFARIYGISTIGLRYFNVFGEYQDPQSVYAAVIPKWITSMRNGEPIYINGDGETTRDFCYIDNAVQANLLAATTNNPEAINQIYNIAVGDCISLNDLQHLIKLELKSHLPELQISPSIYRDFRIGDIRHSLASIDKARLKLGYQPTHTVAQGIKELIKWYMKS